MGSESLLCRGVCGEANPPHKQTHMKTQSDHSIRKKSTQARKGRINEEGREVGGFPGGEILTAAA